MILDRLKQGTAGVHASLEQRLRLVREPPSLIHYSRYLSAMYGFIEPLEERFRALPADLVRELELERRCKASLARRDIAALSLRLNDDPTLERCTLLPRQGSTAEALGALYVLEGSTLGGRLLLRHLESLGIGEASAYLISYGEELGLMWRRLRGVLERHSQRYPERDAALVGAAVETFETLDAWLVSRGAAALST